MYKNTPTHLIPEDLSITDEIIIQSVEQFGTPLFVYDQHKMKQNWKMLRDHTHPKIQICYSVKANPNIAVIKIFFQLGANFEVASLGELNAVRKAGVPASSIIFVGPGKRSNELLVAIEENIKIIVAESPREVSNIQSLAKQMKQVVSVALRINPGKGKGMLSMGGDTQFGMPVKTALDILMKRENFPNIKIEGIHGYLGTQLLDWEVIYDHFSSILEIADELQSKSDYLFSFLDLGGGFGIPYRETDKCLDIAKFHDEFSRLLGAYLDKHQNLNTILVESGRFLVGSSGMFVAQVLDVKGEQDHRFVILDGGINAFGGFDKYAGARPLPIRVLQDKGDPLVGVTLCGPLCTPLDRLAANVLLPLPKLGSIVVIYLAGAYGYSASPGMFLSHGYPCEVLVDYGKPELIRRRISPDMFL